MPNIDDEFSQGWTFHQSGELDRAEQVYRGILQREPGNARVWFVLGTLYQTKKQLDDAEACYQQAVRLLPGEADGHFYLGTALLELGKRDDAGLAFERCLQLNPDHAEALTNLGFILGEQGKLDAALTRYRLAVELKPQIAELHHNIGNVLREQGKLEEAVPYYQEALRLKQDYVKAYINLGITLVGLGRPAEAVVQMRRGLEIQPDFAEGYNSLGAALSTMGRMDAAIAEYQRAIEMSPDYAEAHWNLALVWLLCGQYERGWTEYEWRWRCKKTIPPPSFTQPLWDGSDLHGKTILLQEEQGLGDTIHFIRYASLVKERGGRVVVHAPRALAAILRTCPGIDQLVAKGDPLPAFDVYAPLLSLPRILGTTLSSIPARTPYLFADSAMVEHWRRELAPIRGFRIGIAWQGNPNHPWDRHRSIPLAEFEPIARLAGVHLISLQKGPGSEQLRSPNGRFSVITLGEQVDQTAGPFMDTAAIMRNLDLVIATDTSAAHLAGAMNIPVWVALCLTPDWRWLENRPDSPWYPSMRLFRQKTLSNWRTVFAEMAETLKPHIAALPRSNTVFIEAAPGELIDKITILEIKQERIANPAKLQNVRTELAGLEEARSRNLQQSEFLDRLTAQLKAVNEALWDIEDDIRQCEKAQDFGQKFIELARLVYRQNDRRADLKRQINALLGSRLIEEKSYAPYDSANTRWDLTGGGR